MSNKVNMKEYKEKFKAIMDSHIDDIDAITESSELYWYTHGFIWEMTGLNEMLYTEMIKENNSEN